MPFPPIWRGTFLPLAHWRHTPARWHASCKLRHEQQPLTNVPLLPVVLQPWQEGGKPAGEEHRERKVESHMPTGKRGPEPGSPKAKRGGQAVREKYGPEFYARIGKKGGEAVKKKHGPAFYAEIGKKGGESTKRQQGAEFYSRIGKMGGERGRTAPKEQSQ